MKITLSDEMNKVPAFDDAFKGLCVDNEGDIWLFGEGYGIVLTNKTAAQFLSMSKEEAIENIGPFTPYHGQVTLEN